MNKKKVRPLVLLLFLSPCLALPLWAEYQVETLAEKPEELPEWLAPLLPSEGIRVTRDGAAVVDFWLRQELPEAEPTGELGIEFGVLPEGALVGIVQLAEEWRDYRDQPIPAGTYTLRYGVQPADGDHTGQTWFRDFLMLLPLDKDLFVADSAETDPVVEASKVVSGTAHPAVLALYQVYDGVEETSIVHNDLDQPMLAVIVKSLTLGLVVEGHGPELTL